MLLFLQKLFYVGLSQFINKINSASAFGGNLILNLMENTHIKSTPKDVFLHLFNIVTFYLSVIGFVTLLVQYINALFPDALNYYFTSIANSVRWSTSVLFIAVPAYLFTTWLLNKDLKAEPEKRDLKLRKWLIYFTLFVSAITIIIDLMTFVYYFLDGELSIRFALKVLVVMLVISSVFGYYMWELKRDNKASTVPKILAIVVSVVVLASIIAGFFIVGTPSDQRKRRFDEQRIQELQMIQEQVINYWTMKNKLPENLDNLKDDISGYAVPNDPETKMPYEYKIVEPLKFELCANFALSSKENKFLNEGPKYYSPYSSFQQNWDHEASRVCFERTIDPELYKTKNGETGVEPVMIK